MTASASRLVLGGNMFGSVLDQQASGELLDAFVAAGGTAIDTALVYSDWLPAVERHCGERTLGRWLASRGYPAGVTLATKGGHHDLDRPEVRRLDRDSLRHDAELSLANLGLDSLPLYYLHRDDPDRPVTDILSTLEELRTDGLISRYAACNWTGPRLREAAAACAAAGWAGFATHQLCFSLAVPRTLAPGLTVLDGDLAAAHRDLELPVVAYSAQAKGFFDKVRRLPAGDPGIAGYDTERNRGVARSLAAIADRHQVSATQVALAALLLSPLNIEPVIGCRTMDQLRSALAATDLDFDDQECAFLGELVDDAIGAATPR